MIRETDLELALSRHIARAISEALTSESKLAYAVAIYDAGIEPIGAFDLARKFIEQTARESGYGHDERRIMGEQAAFVAGLVVGRTAREEETE